LLDVDRVDLVVSGYATNMVAPAMPVVMQKGKTFISLFALDVNAEFKYDKYFSMLPTGQDTRHPSPPASRGRRGSEPEADDRRAHRETRVLAQCLRRRPREYQEVRPQDRVDKTSRGHDRLLADHRALEAANADSCVCSYPLSSVGIVLAANELGLKPKMLAAPWSGAGDGVKTSSDPSSMAS